MGTFSHAFDYYWLHLLPSTLGVFLLTNIEQTGEKTPNKRHESSKILYVRFVLFNSSFIYLHVQFQKVADECDLVCVGVIKSYVKMSYSDPSFLVHLLV